MEELNAKLKAEVETELEVALQQFKESEFYKNYVDTYFSDKILREVFKVNLNLHKLYNLKNKKYEEIHQMNVKHIHELVSEFSGEFSVEGRDLVWEMIYAVYIDPDSNEIKQLGDIQCTADGLFSIKRIYRKNGASEKTVSEYETYRKVPVFFFPSERGGINTSRVSAFGDRIDHTLFDLKNYFEEVAKGEAGDIKKCRLHSAYNLLKTKEWLSKFKTFNDLIDWYGVKDIFTNDKYEVYDLEKGNGAIITEYKDEKGYGWLWSETYYENLKKPIDEFTNKKLEQQKQNNN